MLHKSLEKFITILLKIGCLGYCVKFFELQTSNMNNVPLKFFSFLKKKMKITLRTGTIPGISPIYHVNSTAGEDECKIRLCSQKLFKIKKNNQQFTILGLTTVLFVEY